MTRTRLGIVIPLLMITVIGVMALWAVFHPYTIPGARQIWMRNCVGTVMVHERGRVMPDYAFDFCKARYDWMVQKDREGWQ